MEMFQTFQTVFCEALYAGISDEKYEELRRILEKQNRRSFTSEEAKEISDGLIDFFNLLIELDNSVKDED